MSDRFWDTGGFYMMDASLQSAADNKSNEIQKMADPGCQFDKTEHSKFNFGFFIFWGFFYPVSGDNLLSSEKGLKAFWQDKHFRSFPIKLEKGFRTK